MKGSGTPVSGASPRTAKTFSMAWLRISEVIPQASEFCTLTMVDVAPSPAAISSIASTSET